MRVARTDSAEKSTARARQPTTATRRSSAAVMSTPTKYLGVTPPISLSGPTEKDVEITNALEAALRANNVFESSEEAKLRYVLTDAYH